MVRLLVVALLLGWSCMVSIKDSLHPDDREKTTVFAACAHLCKNYPAVRGYSQSQGCTFLWYNASGYNCRCQGVRSATTP